jgi:hypothetical protein
LTWTFIITINVAFLTFSRFFRPWESLNAIPENRVTEPLPMDTSSDNLNEDLAETIMIKQEKLTPTTHALPDSDVVDCGTLVTEIIEIDDFELDTPPEHSAVGKNGMYKIYFFFTSYERS